MTASLKSPPQTGIDDFLQRRHELLIGGKWQPAASGATLEVSNPAIGRVIAHAAAGGAADIDAAVKAARAAFENPTWRLMSPRNRAALINRLADLIEANADEIALIETLNNGMPLLGARHFNIPIAVDLARYQAGWAARLGGETLQPSLPGEWHAYTIREPLGVAGLIVPWNVPFAMAVNKVTTALAAGCAVILKPAEQTPLSAVRLAELVQEAGFPDGVFNLVTGTGAEAGAALVAHPDVDKISFTGSTAVGKTILAASAASLKRVSLELGGKSPVIILADADLERAIDAAAQGIFANSGQVCAAGSRLYAHRTVYDRVVAGVADRARRLTIGSGLEPTTQIGPVISPAQQTRVERYIESGRKSGAEVVVGGNPLAREGWFVEPTVFANPDPKADIVTEEIFGPVLCAMPLETDDLDEIAKLANSTTYGLAATIWTRDIGKAHRLARRIKSGGVQINTTFSLDPVLPFGGFKQSGIGRENGREGVESFTELKTVAVDLNAY